MSAHNTRISRRTFGLTALSTPLSAPLSAPEARSPVMALFSEWKSLRDWIDSPASGNLSDDDLEALVDHLNGIETKMLEAPSTSPRDTLAKIMAYTSMGEAPVTDIQAIPEIWGELQAVLELASG